MIDPLCYIFGTFAICGLFMYYTITSLKNTRRVIIKQNFDTDCVICLEKIKHKTLLSGCSHAFCHSCIRNWYMNKRECPICRAPIRYFYVIRSALCKERHVHGKEEQYEYYRSNPNREDINNGPADGVTFQENAVINDMGNNIAIVNEPVVRSRFFTMFCEAKLLLLAPAMGIVIMYYAQK